jgi:hypothetical protein
MSFLTFHISMFFSASVPLGALMAMFEGRSGGLAVRRGLSKITVLDPDMCVR